MALDCVVPLGSKWSSALVLHTSPPICVVNVYRCRLQSMHAGSVLLWLPLSIIAGPGTTSLLIWIDSRWPPSVPPSALHSQSQRVALHGIDLPVSVPDHHSDRPRRRKVSSHTPASHQCLLCTPPQQAPNMQQQLQQLTEKHRLWDTYLNHRLPL